MGRLYVGRSKNFTARGHPHLTLFPTLPTGVEAWPQPPETTPQSQTLLLDRSATCSLLFLLTCASLAGVRATSHPPARKPPPQQGWVGSQQVILPAAHAWAQNRRVQPPAIFVLAKLDWQARTFRSRLFLCSWSLTGKPLASIAEIGSLCLVCDPYRERWWGAHPHTAPPRHIPLH